MKATGTTLSRGRAILSADSTRFPLADNCYSFGGVEFDEGGLGFGAWKVMGVAFRQKEGERNIRQQKPRNTPSTRKLSVNLNTDSEADGQRINTDFTWTMAPLRLYSDVHD